MADQIQMTCANCDYKVACDHLGRVCNDHHFMDVGWDEYDPNLGFCIDCGNTTESGLSQCLLCHANGYENKLVREQEVAT